jgi:hypothetical protein
VQFDLAKVVTIADLIPQGATPPLDAGIELPSGERIQVILKFPTIQNRAPAGIVLNEYIATIYAEACGIRVAPCYLAEADDAVSGYLEKRFGLRLSSPVGFASKRSPIDPITYPTGLDLLDRTDLARLYCFDLLFTNTDRTPIEHP